MPGVATLIRHRHQPAQRPDLPPIPQVAREDFLRQRRGRAHPDALQLRSRPVRTAAGVAPARTVRPLRLARACRNASSTPVTAVHGRVTRATTPGGKRRRRDRVNVASCAKTPAPAGAARPASPAAPCRRLRYRVRSAVNIARLRSACRASSTATPGRARPSIDPARPASNGSTAAATPPHPADPSSPAAVGDSPRCSRSPPRRWCTSAPPRASRCTQNAVAARFITAPHGAVAARPNPAARLPISCRNAVAIARRRSSAADSASPTLARTRAANAAPTTPTPYTTPARFPYTLRDGVSCASLSSFR